MAVAWLGFLLAAVCLAAGTWQLADLAGHRAHVARRLQAVAAHDASSGRLTEVRHRMRRTRPVQLAEAKLRAAGLDVDPVTFLSGCAGAGLVGLALLFRLGSPTLALIVAVLSALGLRAWLNRRVEQRREQLITQLPDLARLLSNAANAGLAMRTGVEMAAREIAEPARSELQHITQLIAVGYPLEEALATMTQRLPSREVSVLVTTLVVQQRAGGRVITALRNVASTLETRKEVRREIRTAMAGAVSSSYIVACLGLGSVLLLNLISPGVLDEMVGSGPGRLVLVFSTVLYVVGFTAIRRMTRIEP